MKEEVLFFESAASAQSQTNFWTRMASTYRCVEIRLTRERLIIKPRWFIGWMTRLLGLDLYHEVPTDQIQDVRSSGTWFSYGKVLLRFMKNGREQEILLYLKKVNEFLDTMRPMIKK
jgi:hypothetical protein